MLPPIRTLVGDFASQELKTLYENLDRLPKNKLYEKLVGGKDSAFMSKDLATIETDMPLEKKLDDFRFTGFEGDGLRSVSEQYRFTSFLKRFDLGSEKIKTVKTETISPQELTILDDACEFAFLVKDGVRLAVDGETEYVIPLKQTLLDEGYDLNDVLRAL